MYGIITITRIPVLGLDATISRIDYRTNRGNRGTKGSMHATDDKVEAAMSSVTRHLMAVGCKEVRTNVYHAPE